MITFMSTFLREFRTEILAEYFEKKCILPLYCQIMFLLFVFLQSHTILLVQPSPKPEGRTYSDYETVNEMLEGNPKRVHRNYLIHFSLELSSNFWVQPCSKYPHVQVTALYQCLGPLQINVLVNEFPHTINLISGQEKNCWLTEHFLLATLLALIYIYEFQSVQHAKGKKEGKTAYFTFWQFMWWKGLLGGVGTRPTSLGQL